MAVGLVSVMSRRTDIVNSCLLAYVQKHGPVSIARVAAATGLSYETTRRGLKRLQNAGHLRARRPDMRKPSQWIPA